MKSIAIYLEGGGRGIATRDSLRRGMDLFLREFKELARINSWRWKLVCCGSRNSTFDKFAAAYKDARDTIVVLLVDSESPLDSTPNLHLRKSDGWQTNHIIENRLHLMVQMMETWLVSDPNALSAYYGDGFQINSLPRQKNLEEVSTNDIANALKQATRRTKKGTYKKTSHASDLLGKIDPNLTRDRCPASRRLFAFLGNTFSQS